MLTTQGTTEGLLAERISEQTCFCVIAQDYVVKRTANCEGQTPSVLIMINLLCLFCKILYVLYFKMSCVYCC